MCERKFSVETRQKSACGIHDNLVVFGYAAYHRHHEGTLADWQTTGSLDNFCIPRDPTDSRLIGTAWQTTGGLWDPSGAAPIDGATNPDGVNACQDGGPGSVTQFCLYGTHNKCPLRRFAFLPDDAGPDVPDDSCGYPYAGNGICEDGLLYSDYPPGKDPPCRPNTGAGCPV